MSLSVGAVLLAACGQLPAPVGARPSLSAAPPSAAPPSASVAASSSSLAPAASVSAAPASSSASSPAGTVTLTLAPAGNQAQIQATELLVGNAAKSQAVEHTTQVSGAVVLDGQGQPASGSKLTINVHSLSSDQRGRDGRVQQTLGSSTYPDITFVPQQVQGLPWPLPTTGQAEFKLSGDATVRDVTKPLTWNVTAQFTPSGVTGKANTAFTFSDFNLVAPKAGPVISVDNNLTVEVAFQANRSA